jgi:hypothetical protein
LLAQQATGTKTFVSTTDFVAAAQAALTAGTPLNLLVTGLGAEAFGAANAANLNLRFRSDDAVTGGRPRLTVHYTPGPLVGDFSLNNVVDAADYVVWRNAAGVTYGPAEYTGWRTNFGRSLSGDTVGDSQGTPIVPEPSVFVTLAMIGVCRVISRRRVPCRE